MSEKQYNILTIDGGGIRGIIPGQVLVQVEKMLQEINGEGTRISDYFDFIAGTSTGGILTCACLAPDGEGSDRPKFTAKEVVQLYFDRGDHIFNIPVRHRIRTLGGVRDEKYPAEGIETALQDYFGDLWLKDLLKPCLITSYDIKRRKTHFFSQIDAHEPGRNFLVKDVCRATSAAPTYFEAANVKSESKISYPLIDGGVFANNPTMCAYAEVREHFYKTDEKKNKASAVNMRILSLGTGYSKDYYDYNTAKDWGLVGWAKPVIDIMMSGVAETVDFQMKKIFDSVNQPHQYLRLNCPLPVDVDPDMDEASRENLQALGETGTKLAEDNKDKLMQFLKNE